jgi:hypothetical protein
VLSLTETQGYHPGQDLYVKFTTEDEYKVYALAEDSGRNAVSSVSDNVYKVTVANDYWDTLTLTPSVSTHHSVTFQTVAHVTFALLDAADASVYPGKTVKFTAVPDRRLPSSLRLRKLMEKFISPEKCTGHHVRVHQHRRGC